MEDKNTALGPWEEIVLEPGFILLKISNESTENQTVLRHVDKTYVQFHFCLKGQAQWVFNQGNYTLNAHEEQSILLYNTQQDLPLHIVVPPGTWLLSVLLQLRQFHALFSSEAQQIPFLRPENKDQKHYAQEPIPPSIAVLLSQMMSSSITGHMKSLYLKAKVYELMALYFNPSEDPDSAQCPFLADEDNVRKIRKAKEIVLSRMAEPPGLQELADEIGLSLKKLKEGFKQIYGDTVYGFLFDYKMDVARKMLNSGVHNVNEVGLKIGYSTASHFISAFKKKYGTTPKKYLQSLG